MSGPVKVITSKAEFDELVASGSVVIVDIYADWCPPCKQIAPVFEKLAKENAKEGVHFCKVNVDNVPDVATALSIRSIPAFKVFKDGQKVQDLVGASTPALTNLVQTHA